MKKMDGWHKFLHWGAVLTGIFLFCVSIQYSVNGFNVIDPGQQWIGWGMGIAVTVMELVWNKMKMKTNLTIAFGGLAAYVYSIGTNIVGILASQHLGVGFGVPTNPDWGVATGFSLIFAIVLGAFLDILPEPLIIYGFFDTIGEGDFLGNILGQPFLGEKEGENAKDEPKKDEKPSFRPQPTRYSPTNRSSSVPDISAMSSQSRREYIKGLRAKGSGNDKPML